jgi:hypothetical protein
MIEGAGEFKLTEQGLHACGIKIMCPLRSTHNRKAWCSPIECALATVIIDNDGVTIRFTCGCTLTTVVNKKTDRPTPTRTQTEGREE